MQHVLSCRCPSQSDDDDDDDDDDADADADDVLDAGTHSMLLVPPCTRSLGRRMFSTGLS